MATLNVKNLSDRMYRKLQARAKRERRSVAQEVTRILSDALEVPEPLSILELQGLGKEHWKETAEAHVARERGATSFTQMARYGRTDEAERLAADLARRTGETMTNAVIKALRDRLAHVRRQRPTRGLSDDLNEIARRCASLPVLDSRFPDEILGYDDKGLPR